MLIAQISDTHILDRESDHLSQAKREDWLRQCVAGINQKRPDAVIFTGDTVQHGKPEEYAVLRELLSPLEPPLYIVPGNRDDAANLRSAFDEQPFIADCNGFVQYVIDRHEALLVALDSTLPGERKGVFCESRQQWLDTLLRERQDQPVLLFIHHPPFDVGDHYVGGYRNPADAAALETLVGHHEQVQALFCGHVHWPIERRWAGTEARIMPSVAIDLRKGIDEDEFQGRPMFMLHRWSGDAGLVSTREFAGTCN